MIAHPARAVLARRMPSVRRPLRPRLEGLETRLALSWPGVPPSTIVPPTSSVSVNLDSQGDASGGASIATVEVDYYTFVAPTGGSYRFAALTPLSNLDTVLGV